MKSYRPQYVTAMILLLATALGFTIGSLYETALLIVVAAAIGIATLVFKYASDEWLRLELKQGRDRIQLQAFLEADNTYIAKLEEKERSELTTMERIDAVASEVTTVCEEMRVLHRTLDILAQQCADITGKKVTVEEQDDEDKTIPISGIDVDRNANPEYDDWLPRHINGPPGPT